MPEWYLMQLIEVQFKYAKRKQLLLGDVQTLCILFLFFMELTRVWDVCSIYSIEQFAALLCRIGVHCKLIYTHTHISIKAKACQYTYYLITQVNTGRLLSQYLYNERHAHSCLRLFFHMQHFGIISDSKREVGRDTLGFFSKHLLFLCCPLRIDVPPPKPQTLRREVGVRACALMVCLDQALIQGITPPL